MTWTITIPGVMRGKQRPRATRQGRVYTPAQTVNAEAWVKSCAVEQVGHLCLEGPLSIAIKIRAEVPQSWSKKKRDAALDGAIRPTGKPDLDNCYKLIADALNGIVWKDDSQIVSARVSKVYGPLPVTTLEVMVAN